MIGEIAAIVAGVNAATSAIKQGAETTHQNEGKLSEADAVKAALAKKQIQETMREIKDLFTVSGNAQLYSEAMQAMAEARKQKQLELARAAARKKKFWKEVREISFVIGILIILLPMTLGLLLGWLTR